MNAKLLAAMLLAAVSLPAASWASAARIAPGPSVPDNVASKPFAVAMNHCDNLRGARSRNSDVRHTITFRNRSGFVRAIFWIDFRGEHVHWATLNSDESITVDTFESHPWMITDGPGDCVMGFMAERGDRIFNIR